MCVALMRSANGLGRIRAGCCAGAGPVRKHGTSRLPRVRFVRQDFSVPLTRAGLESAASLVTVVTTVAPLGTRNRAVERLRQTCHGCASRDRARSRTRRHSKRAPGCRGESMAPLTLSSGSRETCHPPHRSTALGISIRCLGKIRKDVKQFALCCPLVHDDLSARGNNMLKRLEDRQNLRCKFQSAVAVWRN